MPMPPRWIFVLGVALVTLGCNGTNSCEGSCRQLAECGRGHASCVSDCEGLNDIAGGRGDTCERALDAYHDCRRAALEDDCGDPTCMSQLEAVFACDVGEEPEPEED